MGASKSLRSTWVDEMTACRLQPDCNPTAIELQVDYRQTALSLHTSSERTPGLQTALQRLTLGRKAKRLRELCPAIEAKLAEGITHAQILVVLNENGLDLTERTYKSYLYRYRKRQRTVENRKELRRLPDLAHTQITAGVPPIESFVPETTPDKRPPTFDFDPRGLSPDLLK